MPPRPSPRSERPRLDRQRITLAAVELLDEVGLADLSTRRLAAKLGVRSPTLYWHVRDKDELLDLIAEAICADGFDIDATRPWRDQLISGLRQFRQRLLAHRDAATLLRERPPSGPHRLGHVDATVRILLDAGFSDTEAAGIARMLTAHVLASVEAEGRRSGLGGNRPPEAFTALEAYPSLRRVSAVYTRLSDEELYELASDILLDGLEHRLATRSPTAGR